MAWNWELRDWPDFVRDRQKLAARETRFLEQAGVLIGTSRHISEEDRIELRVLSDEFEPVSVFPRRAGLRRREARAIREERRHATI